MKALSANTMTSTASSPSTGSALLAPNPSPYRASSQEETQTEKAYDCHPDEEALKRVHDEPKGPRRPGGEVLRLASAGLSSNAVLLTALCDS
jgi:hypothetical protein